MYDSTDPNHKQHVGKWGTKVLRVSGRNNDFPLVAVATKCDDGLPPPPAIGISIRSNFNVMHPLLELIQRIQNDDTIEFI
jgi:hypothetical protein